MFVQPTRFYQVDEVCCIGYLKKSPLKMQFFNYKVHVMAISNTKPPYFVDFLVQQKKFRIILVNYGNA